MSNKKVIWCDPADLSKDIGGRTYIVTGANSGVGFETTQQLIKQGAHVIMACRRVEAGEKVEEAFKGLKGSYEVRKCDLADLQSVRDFVSEFLKNHDRLDGLACNAGMVNMDNEPTYTKDGFELTIAASFFGHFLLTEMLLESPSLDIVVTTPQYSYTPNSPQSPREPHSVRFRTRGFSSKDAITAQTSKLIEP